MTTQELLKQLTSPTKIVIACWMIKHSEGLTVTQLTSLMNVERTNISKQISEMKQAGVLSMTEEGRNNIYKIESNLDPIQMRLLKDIVNSYHIIDEGKKDFKAY